MSSMTEDIFSKIHCGKNLFVHLFIPKVLYFNVIPLFRVLGTVLYAMERQGVRPFLF
jgi:hypothetical protein